MDHAQDPSPCTGAAAVMLPWYVNGSLSDADARLVARHLEQCPSCRDEASELVGMRALLRTPAQVEHAPSAGFQKLLARVDAAERADVPVPAPAPMPSAARAVAAAARGGRHLVRWLSAAVVVQALALSIIGTVVLLKRPAEDSTASYRTLSTATPEPAAFRVVFAPVTTLAEVQQLLRAHDLRVTAGPSDAGVFTLAWRGPASTEPGRSEALARLRADPRVRFAEPVGDEGEAHR